MTAREDVLTRIRSAVSNAAPAETVVRNYRVEYDSGDVIERFADRVADYKAKVRRVGRAELAGAIAEEVGDRRVGIPAGLPPEWVAGLNTVVDAPALSIDELDALDGAVTGAKLGIAETGTIVLDSNEVCGRRALSLVPDWHLCVVDVDSVVNSVPQAVAGLAPEMPITFISGPSATSDIELNRVEGVHGPRTLIMLLVG
ncbi:MAG: LUD domain-containing protein [Frankiaceae bacterium]